jgi:hypothetical protein
LPMESMANSLDTALALQATIVPLKIPAQSPHDPGRVALLALAGKVGGWVEQGGESTFSKSPPTSKLTSVSALETANLRSTRAPQFRHDSIQTSDRHTFDSIRDTTRHGETAQPT